MEDYLSVINKQDSKEVVDFLTELFDKKFAQQVVIPEEHCEHLGVVDIAIKCGYSVDYKMRSKLGTYVAKQYSKKDKIKKELRNIKSVKLITSVNLYPSTDVEVQQLIETFCESYL